MRARVALLIFVLIALRGNSGPLQSVTCQSESRPLCGTTQSQDGWYVYKWCKKLKTYNGVAYELKQDIYRKGSVGDTDPDFLNAAAYYNCEGTLDRTYINSAGTCSSYCLSFADKDKVKDKDKENEFSSDPD
jgi:hypothetical protein